MVQGLALHARLVAHPASGGDLTSSLYIEASDGALRAIQAEFGWECGGGGGGHDPLLRINEHRGLGADAYVIEAADERFLFLAVDLLLRDHDAVGVRRYYLVYDAASPSLSMVPFLPEQCSVASTLRPLHVPRGGGGLYDPILLARKPVPPTPERLERRHEEVVCVWTPAAAAEERRARPDPDGVGPWKLMRRRFPEQENPFTVNVIFSFGGQAFWVDLAQGLAHCAWPPATGGGAAVEFGFIGIPPGCPPDESWTKRLSDEFSMNRDRTMRFAAGAIRFVCIDRSRRLGDVTVTLWSLDMAARRWTKERSFRARELWRRWSFRRRGLPEMEPRFPVLMADGTLCLLVRNKPRTWDDERVEDYICNLDLESMSVRWSGRFRQYHCYERPVILPSGFFGKQLRPLVPRKRELRGIFFTQK
ncbi:hypothetical protein SEVIR_9G066300v4 [Setaria viridis]|uniref:DUF1618 domain-containing protein n=1 Tax=Setaria viridis TaxID=4556 RepID=A0A4U6SS09_SETVI|nr:hypothetical protein SEVIR_9G066300v2 [Setaria viridis]